jgi:hypothetical protein
MTGSAGRLRLGLAGTVGELLRMSAQRKTYYSDAQKTIQPHAAAIRDTHQTSCQ